jgi:hypothetical protein
VELESGKIVLGTNLWHHMAMHLSCPEIAFSVDGKEIAAVRDGKCAHGLAGLGTGWNCAQFDNFSVRPAGEGAADKQAK